MKLFFGLALALCLLAGTSAAQAPEPNATLTKLAGKVLVNTGKGFVPAQLNQRLRPGDRLMVMDKSTATIVFDDECTRDVEANKLVTVPNRSTCAGGVLDTGNSAAIGGTSAGSGKALLPIAIAGVVTAVVLDEDDGSP